MLADDSHAVVAQERLATAYHLVEHGSQGLQVGARRNVPSHRLFRWHVGHRADHHAFLSQAGAVGGDGKAEVANLGCAVVGQPDIPWLEVAVNYAPAVSELQSPACFQGDADGLLKGQLVVGRVFDDTLWVKAARLELGPVADTLVQSKIFPLRFPHMERGLKSSSPDPKYMPKLTVDRIDHVALVVTNVAISKKWYRDMFGFDSPDGDPNSTSPYVGNADTKIALLQVAEGKDFAPPVNQGSRACHFAFRTSWAAFEAYQARLAELGTCYEKLTHSDCQSIYFSDPDGYVIEVSTYELP